MIDPNADALDASNEATARKLKADGYRASVVLQKMIQVHHMHPAAAEALVSSIFGSDVKATDSHRRRDIGAWAGTTAVGAAIVAIIYYSYGWPERHDRMGSVMALGGAIFVGGLVQLVRSAFFGMIEDGARKD